MTQTKFAVGDNHVMFCSSCDSDQDHTIETATKQGKITKAVCNACSTSSTFTRGVKTKVSNNSAKAASMYDRTRKYKKGQAMSHEKFGHGEVTAVIEPQKIDVLFGDQVRRLIHAQE